MATTIEGLQLYHISEHEIEPFDTQQDAAATQGEKRGRITKKIEFKSTRACAIVYCY